MTRLCKLNNEWVFWKWTDSFDVVKYLYYFVYFIILFFLIFVPLIYILSEFLINVFTYLETSWIEFVVITNIKLVKSTIFVLTNFKSVKKSESNHPILIGCLSCTCLANNDWLKRPIDVGSNANFLLVKRTKT